MNNDDGILLLVSIVPRGIGQRFCEFLRERNVFMNLIFLGRGSAASEWADLLGLGDSKKDILLTLIPMSREDELINLLLEEFELKEPGNGIAFTVDINSLSSKRLLKYCKGIIEKD